MRPCKYPAVDSWSGWLAGWQSRASLVCFKGAFHPAYAGFSRLTKPLTTSSACISWHIALHHSGPGHKATFLLMPVLLGQAAALLGGHKKVQGQPAALGGPVLHCTQGVQLLPAAHAAVHFRLPAVCTHLLLPGVVDAAPGGGACTCVP